MTYAQETKAVCQTLTLVSTKGVSNKPNSSPVESIESIETFDKRKEFCTVKLQKVSTAKYSNIETVESRSNVSIVSTHNEIGVETKNVIIRQENVLNSEFQQFHQFQRGIVGGVYQ